MSKTPPPPARAPKRLAIEALPEQLPMMSELYRRAEAELRKKRKQAARQRSKANAQQPEIDPRRLLHELQVHQVELELQNAELQEARDRMESSLEQFSDLYDFAPVGYFTLAPDRSIQQVNLNGARLVGIDRGALVGQPFERLVPPGLRADLRTFLQAAFAGPVKQTGDFELLGKKRPFRTVNIEAQRSAGGRECRVVLVDVSERKVAEDQLRESEERFRVMANAMSQMAWIARPDGHVFWYNQRWHDYTGTTPEQMEGWGWQIVHDPVVLPKMLKRWKQSLATGADFEMTFPLRGADGSFRSFLTRGIALKDAAGRVVQWLGTNTDVTEQKLAEEKLRVSEVRYRRLFEAAHDGVLLLDAATRKITDANPFMTQLLGYPIDQLVGKELFEIGLLKDAGASQEMFRKLKRRHEVRYEDLPLESRGGRRQEVEVVANLYQEDGHAVIQCNIRDITERQLAEETRRRLAVTDASNRKLEKEIVRRRGVEKSLRKSEREQRRLLGQARRMKDQMQMLSREVLRVQEEERKRISRELHDVVAQTLTVINVRLDSLKKAAAARTRGIDRDIARTQQLVEKSVDVVHQFARELRPAMLDDLGLVPALHAYVKTFARRHHLRMHLKVFAGLDQLDADKRTVLYRVAQEALSNVAMHAHASAVQLIIQKLPEGIRMTIRDNGRSFRMRQLTDAPGNQRLGLLGMRERLEMIGGQFQVRAVPGVGTTVIALIPPGKTVAPSRRSPRPPSPPETL
jgi:PAS domain S-box-containing protein